MNISLPPDLERFVKEKVETGAYHSSSELIGEALILLRNQELTKEQKLASLQKEIEIGIQQAENGQYTKYEADDMNQLAEDIINRGRAKLSKIE